MKLFPDKKVDLNYVAMITLLYQITKCAQNCFSVDKESYRNELIGQSRERRNDKEEIGLESRRLSE